MFIQFQSQCRRHVFPARRRKYLGLQVWSSHPRNTPLGALFVIAPAIKRPIAPPAIEFATIGGRIRGGTGAERLNINSQSIHFHGLVFSHLGFGGETFLASGKNNQSSFHFLEGNTGVSTLPWIRLNPRQ